jgi:hypothetical protein
MFPYLSLCDEQRVGLLSRDCGTVEGAQQVWEVSGCAGAGPGRHGHAKHKLAQCLVLGQAHLHALTHQLCTTMHAT